MLELPQGPLDRGSGEAQVLGDGADRGPAATLGVRPVLEVHIDRHVPVGEFGGVERIDDMRTERLFLTTLFS